MTEKEFNINLAVPVQFSLATSKIAAEKAVNKNVKEFAGFELAEATALTTVMKDLGTILPEMDIDSKATFAEIEGATGDQLDQLYIRAQVKNHRLLRNLAEDYLETAPVDKLDEAESHSKHLATILLVIFEEHIAVTERISNELGTGENS